MKNSQNFREFSTAHKGVAEKRAIKLAESLGCYNSQSWKKTMECLREASAANITAAFYDYFVSGHSVLWCSSRHGVLWWSILIKREAYQNNTSCFTSTAGMGHGSNDTIPTGGWARFARCIHYQTPAWATREVRIGYSVYDRFDIRWRCNEIST